MPIAGASTATPAVLSTRTRRLRVVLILGMLSATAPLSIDAYLPALPQLADSLGTSSAATQLSLTGFVIGMSLGQLVGGELDAADGAVDGLGERLREHRLADAWDVLDEEVPLREQHGERDGDGVRLALDDTLDGPADPRRQIGRAHV